MDLTFRPVAAAELPAFARAAAIGFSESPNWLDEHARWGGLEVERSLVGFDGDEIVATSRNYSLELTPPGGAPIPAAGVSAVTVRPTHRRRGVLRTMMRGLLDEAVERGETVAMLTASEGAIYERFGFGISTRSMSVHLDRRDVEFARPRPDGRLRLLDPESAAKLEPALFERVRREYPGAVSRPDAWWSDEQWERRMGVRFDVAFESPDGTLDGYACYGVRERHEETGANNTLTVRDLVAANPVATHALWRYLCEVDLVRDIIDPGGPVDTPLPWLLTSNRAPRVRRLSDAVWTRLLDAPAALTARAYPVADRLVLELGDPFRSDGAAAGIFTLDAGPDGAVVEPGGRPDLTADVSAASAAWLGGVRWSTLAAAGQVAEHTPGALQRADRLFGADRAPFPFTWF